MHSCHMITHGMIWHDTIQHHIMAYHAISCWLVSCRVMLYCRRNILCVERSVQCCTLRPKVQDKGTVYVAYKTTSPTVWHFCASLCCNGWPWQLLPITPYAYKAVCVCKILCSMCMCMCMCMRMCMRMCMSMSVSMCVYVHMYIMWIDVRVYVCPSVRPYVCAYIRT